MFRRLITASGVTLAAAVLLTSGPLSARAQEVALPVSDALAIVGTATITTDSDNDTPASVDLIGGTGTFTFTDVACAGWSDAAEVDACHVSASGSFTNAQCGTGTANGSATVTSVLGLGDNITTTFGIGFTAGVGTISGTVSGTSPDGAGIPGAQVADGSESITGVVLLLPPADSVTVTHDAAEILANPTNPNAWDCVHGFTIVAAVAALEGPNS